MLIRELIYRSHELASYSCGGRRTSAAATQAQPASRRTRSGLAASAVRTGSAALHWASDAALAHSAHLLEDAFGRVRFRRVGGQRNERHAAVAEQSGAVAAAAVPDDGGEARLPPGGDVRRQRLLAHRRRPSPAQVAPPAVGGQREAGPAAGDLLALAHLDPPRRSDAADLPMQAPPHLVGMRPPAAPPHPDRRHASVSHLFPKPPAPPSRPSRQTGAAPWVDFRSGTARPACRWPSSARQTGYPPTAAATPGPVPAGDAVATSLRRPATRSGGVVRASPTTSAQTGKAHGRALLIAIGVMRTEPSTAKPGAQPRPPMLAAPLSRSAPSAKRSIVHQWISHPCRFPSRTLPLVGRIGNEHHQWYHAAGS